MTRIIMMNADNSKWRSTDFSRIIQKILFNHINLRHLRSITFNGIE